MAYFLLSAQALAGGKGCLTGWWHLGARNRTWVNLMQGKLFMHCTLALAPVRVFFIIAILEIIKMSLLIFWSLQLV